MNTSMSYEHSDLLSYSTGHAGGWSNFYEMKLVCLVANSSAAASRSIEVTSLLNPDASSPWLLLRCDTPKRAMFDSTCGVEEA